MDVSKHELLTKCGAVFSGDPANSLSLLTTKLEGLGLRLGQISWVGHAKSDRDGTLLQIVLNIPRGSVTAKRKIRLNKHFQIVLDETKEPKQAVLGFDQTLSHTGGHGGWVAPLPSLGD